MPNVTVTREGRRSYLSGDTYPLKDAIKTAGGHWDADRRAWWIGDEAKAQALAAKAAAAPPDTKPFAFGFAKLPDDSWGIRGKNLVAGAVVNVKTKAGDVKSETILAVLSTAADGTQTASLVRKAKPRPAGRRYGGGQGYGGRGCHTDGDCSSMCNPGTCPCSDGHGWFRCC